MSLTLNGFLARFFFALALVFATYNPSGYSYAHWAKEVLSGSITPYIALAGIALIIGWVIFIRATIFSLGVIGITLFALLFGCIVWLFIDIGWFKWTDVSVMTWVLLVLIALLLTMGMSWSHIRKRLTGQIDTNDVED